MSLLHTLEGARHSCLRCGSSCRHSAIGPVTVDEIERVEGSGIRQQLPGLPDRLWFESTLGRDEEDAPVYQFFESDAYTCIFLLRDNFCGVQKHLGWECKPLICRLFPLVFTRTPSGLFVSDSMECRLSLAAMTEGAKLEDRRDELLQIWKGGPPHFTVGEAVELGLGQSVSYQEYEQIEGELRECASSSPSLEERLGRMILQLRSRLGQEVEPSAREEFASEFTGFITELSKLAEQIAQGAEEQVLQLRWRMLGDVWRSLVTWLDPTGFAFESECSTLMHAHLDNFLFGKHLVTESSLLDGLALYNFRFITTLGFAAYKATLMCRGRVDWRDYSDAQVTVQLMAKNTDLCSHLAERLPALRRLFLDNWRVEVG